MSLQNMARITKTVRKLEKPRPLKIANHNRHSTVDGRLLSSVDEIMTLADDVSMNLVNGSYDAALNVKILTLCNYLKVNGQQLETIYKDQLDRAFVIFRNGCRDGRLDLRSKMHLLQLIELRGNNWLSNDNLNSYYKPKINSVEVEMMPLGDPVLLGVSPPSNMSPTTAQPPLLGPGEVIKTSGKFSKPTKIPGKNYCKDEVVIRNSDSGKVSPGAKERLVQITGPNEDKINYAKQLIEDTIRRNASPVRLEHPDKDRIGGSSSSLNSSASDESNRLTQGVNRSKLLHSYSTNDASLEEYKHTVTVGNETIKITGSNPDLVRTAKLILDEFFYPEERNTYPEDVFIEYENELTQSHKTATPAIGSRVGSMDSGATSESDETYKAPLPAQTEANQLVVVRQPLFPDASKEAFEQAELSSRTTDLSARNRRAFFAHTNSQQQSTTEQTAKEETQLNSILKREPLGRLKILQCGASIHSHNPPDDWERLIKEFPAIVKKNPEFFDPVAYIQKWQEVEVYTSVLLAVEPDSPDPE